MSFSSLIEKLVNGEGLSPDEKQEMVLEARRLEQAEQLLSGVILPGTRIIRIDGLETTNAKIDAADIRDASFTGISVANAQIRVDEFGIFIANQEGMIGFQNAALTADNTVGIYIDGFDTMVFFNREGSVGFRFAVDSATADPMYLSIFEDAERTERLHVDIGTNQAWGSKITLGGKIGMVAAGDTDGYTYVLLGDAENTPPTPVYPAGHLYVKGSKLVCQFEDSGTVRYKYLDLTGTGTTWIHTTTAP